MTKNSHKFSMVTALFITGIHTFLLSIFLYMFYEIDLSFFSIGLLVLIFSPFSSFIYDLKPLSLIVLKASIETLHF